MLRVNTLLYLAGIIALVTLACWLWYQAKARAHMRMMLTMYHEGIQSIPRTVKLENPPQKISGRRKYEVGDWMIDEAVGGDEAIAIARERVDQRVVRSVAAAGTRRSPISMSCPWCHGKHCQRCRWEGIVPMCSHCNCPLLWEPTTSMWLCTSSSPH